LRGLLALEEVRHATRLAVESLLLRALALVGVEKQAQAEETLTEALGLAEAEGYIRLFLGGGKPMARLLSRALQKCKTTAYVETLRAAISAQETAREKPAPAQALVDPLTKQELSILRLMAAGLSHREIAGELHLSINTIKWYTL